MASTKSVRFNIEADVIHYEFEEYVEEFCATGTTTREPVEEEYIIDPSPRHGRDAPAPMAEVVAAVYRARHLRAEVEQDLKKSLRSDAPGTYHSEDTRFTQKSTSLIGQLWRRVSDPHRGRSTRTKIAHGRRGSLELLQGKHHFMSKKTKEDAWTQSFYGVGPSNPQTRDMTDTPVSDSDSAASAPLPSPRSPQKKTFWFRARISPVVPM
eukprot:TRINITY_DN22520_c0_g1_i1.p1 TRINITY_DN22520_c0_g1~~TRINITY_DN22520_c0_g1_i1.p1  ORF type:complete len:210 (-),score=26.42 TRINITY_DN22520_c0_g1_i1:118-747(-)